MSNIAAAQLFTVKDMVFVITGGGSGIGAMMAQALDINGASKVYIVGRRLEKLQEVASAAINKSIIPFQGDITSKESLSSLAEKVKKEVGWVNVVIANSGITGPDLSGLLKDRIPTISELQSYLWEPSMQDFNATFMANSTAMFYTLTAFLALLDTGNTHPQSTTLRTGVKSQFIATSSIGGFARKPGMGYAYAGSKAAVIHMIKQISTGLVPYQIRANCFAPGIYPSDMSFAFLAGKDATQEGSIPDTVCPAKRSGTEEDAAGLILFLCSRAGAYLNGNVVVSDGGRLGIGPATY